MLGTEVVDFVLSSANLALASFDGCSILFTPGLNRIRLDLKSCVTGRAAGMGLPELTELDFLCGDSLLGSRLGDAGTEAIVSISDRR